MMFLSQRATKDIWERSCIYRFSWQIDPAEYPGYTDFRQITNTL